MVFGADLRGMRVLMPPEILGSWPSAVDEAFGGARGNMVRARVQCPLWGNMTRAVPFPVPISQSARDL